MIPKKIHYCWFGRGEKPDAAKKCIASWQKFCPDYEIIEWNEDNFDLNCNPYIRWCYANKKWAFLSDMARLMIVYEQGGIYFDTDVELIRSPEALLKYEAFYGWENESAVNTGQGFGAMAHHRTVEAMLRQYLAMLPDAEGNFSLTPCPALNTAALAELGLETGGRRQTVAGAEILPADYMNPYDDPTGKLRKTANTVSIHWYAKSWISPAMRLRSKLTKPFHRLFGTDCFGWLKRR